MRSLDLCLEPVSLNIKTGVGKNLPSKSVLRFHVELWLPRQMKEKNFKHLCQDHMAQSFEI